MIRINEERYRAYYSDKNYSSTLLKDFDNDDEAVNYAKFNSNFYKITKNQDRDVVCYWRTVKGYKRKKELVRVLNDGSEEIVK